MGQSKGQAMTPYEEMMQAGPAVSMKEHQRRRRVWMQWTSPRRKADKAGVVYTRAGIVDATRQARVSSGPRQHVVEAVLMTID